MYLVLLLRTLEYVHRAGRRLRFFRLSFHLLEIVPVIVIIIIIIIIIYCCEQCLALRNFTSEFSDDCCIFYIARNFPIGCPDSRVIQAVSRPSPYTTR